MELLHVVFWWLLARNQPLTFETYRAQSENVFYLCVPSSETLQISMWITGLCLRTPKNTEDAWMSFVCSWRLFKVQANCYRLSTRKIIVKKEYIYFNLPNKGTERLSSFTWFVDSEFWMPLLFSICRKLSDWRLQLDISRKSDILSRAEHTAMSTWSLCTWGFHSHFFSSVTIVAREHSPVLVACVWRETKARSFFAQNLASFALCYYVIGLFNRVQTNHKHKRKRKWLVVSSRFFGGSIAEYPKKRLRRRLVVLVRWNDLDGSFRSRYFRSFANEKNMFLVWIALLT